MKKESSANNEKKSKAKVEQKTENKVEKKSVSKTEVKAEPKAESKIKGTVTIKEKHKTDYAKWIGIVVAIIVLVAMIIGIVFFTKSPYYAVMKTFNALKSERVNIINNYVSYQEIMDSLIDGLNVGEEMSEIEKNCFDKFEYKQNSVKTEGDTAIVTVETTNKNFRNALTKWTQSIYQRFINGEEISNEQGINLLNEYLSDESIGTMSVTKDINLNKVDNKWRLNVDENLKDAVFPGLSEVVNSIDALTTD